MQNHPQLLSFSTHLITDIFTNLFSNIQKVAFNFQVFVLKMNLKKHSKFSCKVVVKSFFDPSKVFVLKISFLTFTNFLSSLNLKSFP